MLRSCLLMTMLAACGGDASVGNDAPGPGGSLFSSVRFPGLATNVTLVNPSFNHPMVVSDGTRVHAVGSQVSSPPSHVLSWFDGLAPTHAIAFDATNPDDAMDPTMVVPDGAGGAYIAGRLSVPALSSYDPGVVHFDRAGTVVWSKRYSAGAPYWSLIPQGVASGVAISEPVAGKLVVAGGVGVVAIDATGTPLWSKVYDNQMQIHQVLADVNGVTLYAVRYNDIYQLRFDWTGAVVSTTHAPMAFASGVYAIKLLPPHITASGNTMIPYGASKLARDNMSGVMVLDASGAVVDNFGYEIVGEEDPTGPHASHNVLHDDGVTRVLTDDHIEVRMIYADSRTPPPYVYHRPRFVLEVDTSNTPTQNLSQSEADFVAVGDNVLSLSGGGGISAGKVGLPCSYRYYELTSITKIAGDQPITPFVVASDAPQVLPVTALDVPITTTDGGDPVVIVAPSCGT